jgi:hypothetical protein
VKKDISHKQLEILPPEYTYIIEHYQSGEAICFFYLCCQQQCIFEELLKMALNVQIISAENE